MGGKEVLKVNRLFSLTFIIALIVAALHILAAALAIYKGHGVIYTEPYSVAFSIVSIGVIASTTLDRKAKLLASSAFFVVTLSAVFFDESVTYSLSAMVSGALSFGDVMILLLAVVVPILGLIGATLQAKCEFHFAPVLSD